MDACERKIESTNRHGGGESERLPWLDNVEQHWVGSALPYFEGIRAFELGDPYRIKVVQRVRIPT
jgi:hypothetical protein